MRPLRQPGRAAQHDHRRFLGVRPRDAVAGAQAADAVRHADAAQAVDPRIGVGREPRAVLPGHPDQLGSGSPRSACTTGGRSRRGSRRHARRPGRPAGRSGTGRPSPPPARSLGHGDRRRSVSRRRPAVAGPAPSRSTRHRASPLQIVNGPRPAPVAAHPSGPGGRVPSGAMADCRRKPRRDKSLASPSRCGGTAPGRPLPTGRAGSPAPPGSPDGR